MKNVLILTLLIITTGLVLTACSQQGTKAKTEQLATGEIFTCTMHNEVMSDHAGECSKCNMKLVKQKLTEEQRKMLNEGSYIKPKD